MPIASIARDLAHVIDMRHHIVSVARGGFCFVKKSQ